MIHSVHGGALSARAIDAVHRIITDQDRITQVWIEGNADQGLSEEQYVELLGVTVTVFSIDEFNHALGLPLEPWPQLRSGKPCQYRPPMAVRGTDFVSMLPKTAKFTEREKGLLPKNRSANVLRALSLVPDAVRDWSKVAAAQYLPAELLTQFERGHCTTGRGPADHQWPEQR
ncbi:MAG: hypothetical protein P8J17_05890 [Halioglobus sp.]|nr:hypothetical protein [Halioglobus sp.]